MTARPVYDSLHRLNNPHGWVGTWTKSVRRVARDEDSEFRHDLSVRRSPGDPIMRFGTALLFCLMATAAGAQEFATVTTNAPIYATAQETPTPVRVAAVGSRLRVISTEQDWIQVEYNDPVVGRRVGWVLRHYVSLGSHDLQPMDLSVPEAQPVPQAPGQPAVVPPATVMSLPFPLWETSLGWSFLRVSGEFLDANSAAGYALLITAS